MDGTTLRRRMACAIAAMFAIVLAVAFAKPLPAQAQGDEQLTVATQAAQGALEPGVYYIQSKVPGTALLDIEGASTAAGANAQIWTANATKAQQWRVERKADGTYTIRCEASGRYLGSAGGKAGNGVNVEQRSAKASAAQSWTIKASGNAFVVASADNGRYVLDVSGAYSSDGTNVQLYKANGTAAQSWWFVPVKPDVSSERTVSDGVYEMRFAAAPKFAIDLEDGGYANGTNVQLLKRGGSLAQRWYFRWESDGFYSIRSVSSGKVLSVGGVGCAVRSNVRSWSASAAAAKRWAVERNADGSFTLVSKASGLALDVAGGKAANGTNVRVWPYAAGRSQKLDLVAADGIVPEGAYTMYSLVAPAKAALDIPGAKTKAGVGVQLYAGNGTIAQRFYVRALENGAFTIQSACSGLYLADSSGKVVQQKRSGGKAQQWEASYEGGGIAFANAATGKRLAAAGGKSANGTKLVTAKKAAKKAQRFRLVSANLIPDGFYTLRNAAAKKMLDVAGSSTKSKANVLVRKANGKTSQVWLVVHVSGGYYRLIDVNSGKALEVAGSSKKAGGNVRQSAYKKLAAQLWSPRMRADGCIEFTNKASGLVLAAAGTKNKANVRQAAASGKTVQGWKLAATSSGDRWREIELGYLDDPDVSQILEVKYWGGSDAWVQLRVKKGYTWRTVLGCWGYVGAAGIGQASMWSTRTPSGDFGITHAFGIKSDPGAWLPYVQVTSDMWWCGDRTAYNQLIYMSQIPHDCDGEHLIDYAPHYNYGLFFDYNTDPIVYGAGAAFFVHCTGGSTYTGGCVAVDEWYMKRFIRKIKPGARLCIY